MQLQAKKAKVMKNIIEGNKLIAEFMGLTPIKVAKGLPDIKYRHKFTQHGFYEETHEMLLLFHSSWDWLMPVVEKIERIDFVVIIKQSECVIVNNSGNNPKFIQEVALAKIEATWFTVVEFIKWYNKKKVTLK